MPAGEIRVGDIGTTFDFTVKEDGVVKDISAASTKNVVFKRPDGSVLTKPLAFVNTGVDGRVRYVTISGDLNVEGDWDVQAVLTLPAGTWRTDTVRFKVHPNLA